MAIKSLERALSLIYLESGDTRKAIEMDEQVVVIAPIKRLKKIFSSI
jgi:hypothetical protein